MRIPAAAKVPLFAFLLFLSGHSCAAFNPSEWFTYKSWNRNWLLVSGGGSLVPGAWGEFLPFAPVTTLAWERPLLQSISLEGEASYSRRSLLTDAGEPATFSQWGLGARLKTYPFPELHFRPFLAGGVHALWSPSVESSSFVGAPEFLVGAEVPLSPKLEFGVRASWLVPLWGLPPARVSGGYTAHGEQSLASLSPAFCRFSASLKFGL